MRSTTAPIARRRGRIAGRLRRKRDADAWHALGLLDRGGCMASWSRPVAVGIFPSRGHRRARAPSDVTFRCPDPWPDDIIRRLSGPSPIAQSVERRTVNPQVPGSSPGRGANRINRLPAVPGAHSQRAIRRNPWPVRRGSSKWPGADAQQFRVRRKVAIRPFRSLTFLQSRSSTPALLRAPLNGGLFAVAKGVIPGRACAETAPIAHRG